MKQNQGSVSPGRDEDILRAFTTLFAFGKGKRPNIIVETGTYHGTGTTAMIVEAAKVAFKRPDMALQFYTIEADSRNFEIASKNLAGLRWVHLIHGSSVELAKAEEFIRSDEMLLNHGDYPDIAKDAADAIPFYLSEIRGQLPVFGGSIQGVDNVLMELWPKLDGKIPLFVLDSCGGIGWLEFQTICEMMGDSLFYVWCHDIAHVKHYRSYLYMKDHSEGWEIVEQWPKSWALFAHKAAEDK
jgi:hypothetical protein